MNKRVITHAPHLGPGKNTKPVGMGTKIQKVIHAAVDALPLHPQTKKAIIGCGGCARRAAAINMADAAVRRAFQVAAGVVTGQKAGNPPDHATPPQAHPQRPNPVTPPPVVPN